MRPLPEYPWESLKPFREQAAQHPHSVVDLSIGTPVDPTPEIIQQRRSFGKRNADAGIATMRARTARMATGTCTCTR